MIYQPFLDILLVIVLTLAAVFFILVILWGIILIIGTIIEDIIEFFSNLIKRSN